MSLKIKKRISAKIHSLKVLLKLRFFKNNEIYMDHSLIELLNEYKEKKKIVVFCSGPSGKKVTIENDYLYLVTNDGYKRMVNENVEYLLYLNDQYCVRRILANNSVYKNNQKDRKSTRLNSSHVRISYAVFCLKKKNRPPLP